MITVGATVYLYSFEQVGNLLYLINNMFKFRGLQKFVKYCLKSFKLFQNLRQILLALNIIIINILKKIWITMV